MSLGAPFYLGSGIFFLIPALVLTVYAQWKVRSTYARYARVASRSQVTAATMARRILEQEMISDVEIGSVQRELADHYDPRTRTLKLSASDSTSVAAIGIAAHEAGHAIQHARRYPALVLRTALVPTVNVVSSLAMPLFFVGLLFNYGPLMTTGIIAFSLAVLFTLVTLPVELDASRRAVAALRQTAIVSDEELGAVKEVLFAAALTYVAAVAMAVTQLARLLLLRNRRS